VQSKTISIMDYEEIPKMLAEFMEKIEELGPNPMKGF
jgi:quinone-modifying oxidoreductase subunit QmoB